MKKTKKLLAKLMVFALILAYIPTPASDVSAAGSKVSTKMYTISKKAGTYTSAFKITIKAKKGYKVYYTTGSSLNIKKVIKSGKKKTLTISKTTTLKIYAVKKSTSITKKKLKTSAVNKKTKSYKYTVKTSDDTTADTTASDTTAATTTQTAADVTTATESTVTTPGTPGSGDNNQPSSPSGDNTNTGNSETKSAEDIQGDIDEVISNITETATTEAAAGSDSSYDETIRFTQIALGSLDSNITDGNTSYTPDDDSYTYTPATTEGTTTTPRTLTFNKLEDTNAAYNYELSGNLDNIEIKFDKAIKSDITLKLKGITIDNSGIISNEPVIQFSKKAASATLVLEGTNTILGAYEFDHGYGKEEPNEPSPLIKYANENGTLLVTGDSASSLTLTDSMDSSTVSYKSKASADAADYTYEVDPVDGISTKGALVIDTEGTITINVNGNALNAKAEANMEEDEDGNESFTGYTSGGVTIKNGTVKLTSNLSKGINSKYGLITIAGGTTDITSADDAVKAKSYNVQITGGTLNVNSCGGDGIRAGNTALIADGTTKIDKCYGDGIQAENIEITAGKLDIATYYEYAATNFYSSNWSGYTNSITESNSTKTETINYDTGSHKALKAGTKEKTYSYTSITDTDTSLAAKTHYTQEASGGLVITGGTITLDTRNTGIKYNGGSASGGSSGPGGGGGDSKSIIGAPDDAIHSNNTAAISGGDITIYSSDDGITTASELNILNSAKINIATAYEGIEGGTIVIGKASGFESEPEVTVYSNDDGINASSKTNVTYVYADENEETYTKTTTSSSNNTLTVTAGKVTVEIPDDQSHSVKLNGTEKDGTGSQTYTFRADGDGIDCNGSFYAYGGTIITVGGTSNGNGVFDCDGSFVIGEGVTIFGIGTNGMVEGPTEVNQAYIEYGNNSSGGMGPQNGGGNGSSSSISEGATLTIADSSGKTLYTYTTKKSASYIIFSSPELTSGSSYTLKSGSTTLSTLTAGTTASSSGGGGTPPEMPGGNNNVSFGGH